MNIKHDKRIKDRYSNDFTAWADEQALLLEQQRWDELDLVHLIEEVKDLGDRHRDALESQLTRLLMHLLKWQFQPEKRSKSWESSIKEARKQIERLIRKHPVLKIHLETALEQCYLDAREDASDETNLDLDVFPVSCPYSITEIGDRNFLS